MNVRRALLLNRTLPLTALLGLALSSSGCWTKLKPPAATPAGTGTAAGPSAGAGGGTNPQANNANGNGNGNSNGTPGSNKRPTIVPTPDALTAAKQDCASLNFKPGAAVQGAEPIEIPANLTVKSATDVQAAFAGLTDAQKQVVLHLTNAGRIGRAVRFFENHRYATTLRNLFSDSLADANAGTLNSILSPAEQTEWRAYAALFHQNAGPYSADGRKFIMKVVTPQNACIMIDAIGRKSSSKGTVAISANARAEMVSLLLDPAFEPLRRPRTGTTQFTDLALSGGNLYSRLVTGDEAQAQITTTQNPNGKIAPDINCRVVADKNSGTLSCEDLNSTSPDPVGPAFTQIANELKLAEGVMNADGKTPTLSPEQIAEIDATIKFLTDSKETDFTADHKSAMNSWADESQNPVDFAFGFLNKHADFMGNMAGWESHIQLPVPALYTQAAFLLAELPELEKAVGFTQPTTLSPIVPMFAISIQSEANHASRSFGVDGTGAAKRVVLLESPSSTDPTTIKAQQVFTVLRETIGRNSGAGPTTADALRASLGVDGPEIEELRQDMVALALAGDPSLIAVAPANPSLAAAGLYANADEQTAVQHAMYDWYIQKSMQTVARDQGAMDGRASKGAWLFLYTMLNAKVVGLQGVVSDYPGYQKTCQALATQLEGFRANANQSGLASLLAGSLPQASGEQTDQMKAIIAAVPVSAYVDQRWEIRAANGTSGSLSLQFCGDGTLAKFNASCGN